MKNVIIYGTRRKQYIREKWSHCMMDINFETKNTTISVISIVILSTSREIPECFNVSKRKVSRSCWF